MPSAKITASTAYRLIHWGRVATGLRRDRSCWLSWRSPLPLPRLGRAAYWKTRRTAGERTAAPGCDEPLPTVDLWCLRAFAAAR